MIICVVRRTLTPAYLPDLAKAGGPAWALDFRLRQGIRLLHNIVIGFFSVSGFILPICQRYDDIDSV